MQNPGLNDAVAIMDTLGASLAGSTVLIRQEQVLLCGVGRGVLWRAQVRPPGSRQGLSTRLDNVTRMARLLGYRLVLEAEPHAL